MHSLWRESRTGFFSFEDADNNRFTVITAEHTPLQGTLSFLLSKGLLVLMK